MFERSLCLALFLTACTHAESPRAEAHTVQVPDVVAEAPEETGSEVEEPPAPDAATLANGRTLVLPGPEGFVSTWPILARAPAPLDPEAERALGACEGCEIRAFDHFRLELDEVATSLHRSVYVGATLLVTRDTRAFAMIGMRGAASVLLDGEAIASGTSDDRFRRDVVMAPLALPAGEHRLVVRFDRPEEGEWRGAIRFFGARHQPGIGNVAIAIGTLDEARAAELAAASVRIDEHRLLIDEHPSTRLIAWRPGGGVAQPVLVTLGGEERTLAPEEGMFRGRETLDVTMPERGPLGVSASVGDREIPLGVALGSDRRALATAARLRALLATAPADARAPITWRAEELAHLVHDHDGDPAWRSLLDQDAHRIERALARGRDPFSSIHGYERMAFISTLDGTAQEYELFVPLPYRAGAERRWPLVVTLHGLKGNAGDYFRNTFGLARDYDNEESLIAHGRYGPAPTAGPMFVIAPTGRGQSFYRQAGEIDVLEAMDDVRRRFPEIDPDRIYVTGGSMGGTGAAYLPYRHPDLFAASAALAGYHDQRVREDTDHDGLSAAERFLEAERSDVDWAENGLHLPMMLVRGTRDRPLEWTRCLVRRLNALGYQCEAREPDLGHNVWSDTYANGAIFDWFAHYRRPTSPDHVILRTGRELTQRANWVRIDQRLAPDVFAEVDAHLADAVITAQIDGAQAVTFDPALPSITVRVADSTIEGAPPLTIERTESGSWQRATHSYPEEGVRRPDVAGPIREIFHEPLTFVIGTQDPDHILANTIVARRFSHPKGWIVDYPIVRDVDVTDEMIRDRALVLIGPPSSNAVLARIADRLPIRITDEAIFVGQEEHRGEHVGTAFIAPNPLNPNRPVLVLAGLRPLGTLHASDLPDILPDYVVYDERVRPARDRWACGGTGCVYRAEGFFDMHWHVR